MRWAYAMPMCVLFVSSGPVSFSTRGPVLSLTTDLYFKCQLYAEDPGHRKPVLILPSVLSKPGERTHDTYLISDVIEIRTHNHFIESSRCYHCVVTALNHIHVFSSTPGIPLTFTPIYETFQCLFIL